MKRTISPINNCTELVKYLKQKAARLTKRRYVVFTKKYLEHKFVLMLHTNDLQEAEKFLSDQPVLSAMSSPRILFDQEEGIILETRNDDLVLETMEYIKKSDNGKIAYYPFRYIPD
jgi:hypothetical protein